MMILRVFATLSLVLLLLALSGVGFYLTQTDPRVVPPTQVAVGPTVTSTATMPPTATPLPLGSALDWFPGSVVDPSSTPTVTPSVTPTAIASPGPPPGPPIEPRSFSASFRPGGGAFMHNVRVALDANNGALRRVVVPPGETFSFIAHLGPRPYALPWRDVYVRLGETVPGFDLVPVSYNPQRVPRATTGPVVLQEPTPGQPWVVGTTVPVATVAPPEPVAPPEAVVTVVPHPTIKLGVPMDPGTSLEPKPTIFTMPEFSPPDAPPEATAVATAEPPPIPVPMVPVLGGGVCDLASRYVVAARPFLPDEAFTFKLHPNGLAGVRFQDAVSIWFDGSPADLDLRIKNTTAYWIVFTGDIDEDGEVTITATLQGPPELVITDTPTPTVTATRTPWPTREGVEASATTEPTPTATITIYRRRP